MRYSHGPKTRLDVGFLLTHPSPGFVGTIVPTKPGDGCVKKFPKISQNCDPYTGHSFGKF